MWMSGRGFTRGCDQDHRFARTRLFSAESSSWVFAPKNKAGHRFAPISTDTSNSKNRSVEICEAFYGPTPPV